jgi:hypothetical protein
MRDAALLLAVLAVEAGSALLRALSEITAGEWT